MYPILLTIAKNLYYTDYENGSVSECIHLFTRVSHGGMLGPLLFTIYINDLPSVLRFSKHMIYTVDTQIYLFVPPLDFDAGIDAFNSNAEMVAKWAEENLLKLNVFKTKLIVIGSRQYIFYIHLSTRRRVSIFGESLS